MNPRRFALAVLLSFAAFAQDLEIADILRRSEEALKINGPQAGLYAYREYIVFTKIDKNGKEKSRRTEAWDVIGLEGSSYRRLIRRDDKPLSSKEQKVEDKRLAEETKKRQQETEEQRRNRLFSLQYTLSFGPESIHLYNTSYLGEEVLNGRPAHMIEGIPKADMRPANDNEKELLHYRMKRRIDKETFLDARVELEVIRPGSRMQPGTLISITFRPLDDGVWVPAETYIDFNIRFFKLGGDRGTQIHTRSDFHKFEVNSRIVDASQ